MQLRTVAAIIALCGSPALAQDPPAWTRATDPFPIVGPISYVGSEGLAAYLIRTPAGAILMDGTMAENVPAIERNIAASGVRMRDVKLILLSHAHFDHAAGVAGLQKASGAELVVGRGDASAMRTGVPPGETTYTAVNFPPAQVGRAVRDGDRVTLGGVTLTAIATPGHTPGCTSWSMRVVERGRPLDVLFLCSMTVAGNKLFGNRRYPTIVADFRRSFARIAGVHADVVLPFHPEFGDVMARHQRKAGGQTDAFVAPELLPKLVADARAAFDAELARQQTPPR